VPQKQKHRSFDALHSASGVIPLARDDRVGSRY
jgi:hypothetical protein